MPTFGGLSEVAQIACRASAVGGATYVLNCSVDDLSTCLAGDDDKRVQVKLGNGDIVTTRHVVGTLDQMPCAGIDTGSSIETIRISRSISIIDSPLTHLFARTSEGAPAPAASVVVVPSAAEMDSEFAGVSSPVHLIVHSSDTGECPTGQCKQSLFSCRPMMIKPYEYLSTLPELLMYTTSDNLKRTHLL